MSKFNVRINGEYAFTVQGEASTPKSEFVKLIKEVRPAFNEALDVLEIECLDAPDSSLLRFPTSAYMQTEVFAVEHHIDNLILTYGLDMVVDTLAKRRYGRVA